ncbi:SOS response-associated peptidase [Halobacterium zhouii]|uniref:SOS response-associated peptidase n=1 Tax=Halobacterium zhouii TaxID=2902624 RepID=UPI001E349F11|nr:SOS response-associated peptidase [Halobacterium zhouii]
MCGRTSLAVPVDVLSERFDATATDAVEAYLPKYNVDPGDGLVTITNEQRSVADVFEWGFVPEWADDPDEGPTPINARSESVTESNLFRDAFEERRCLVLADGFYEWQGERGSKQPYRVVRRDRGPFAFAGLWSHWESESGADPSRDTVTILTTEPNHVVESIHDRMPVMLERDEETPWLEGDAADAMDVLDPYPSSDIEAYPVSKQVNNPAAESPALFDAIDVDEQSGLDDFAS